MIKSYTVKLGVKPVRKRSENRLKDSKSLKSVKSSANTEKISWPAPILYIVIYRLVKVKSDSRDYFVLYTDEQKSISPFFQYVNFEIGHLAYNTREQAAHALRQLYCYISLIKPKLYYFCMTKYSDTYIRQQPSEI